MESESVIREDIRIRVAGIYVQNNKILLVQHRKNNKEYYLLPGGGQHTGENSLDALIREWKEELNLDIIPGEFAFLGESIPPDINNRKHVYQIVFSVKAVSGDLKLQPDNTLVGHAWVDIDNLKEIILFPCCVDQIFEYLNKKQNPERYICYKWNN